MNTTSTRNKQMKRQNQKKTTKHILKEPENSWRKNEHPKRKHMEETQKNTQKSEPH